MPGLLTISSVCIQFHLLCDILCHFFFFVFRNIECSLAILFFLYSADTGSKRKKIGTNLTKSFLENCFTKVLWVYSHMLLLYKCVQKTDLIVMMFWSVLNLLEVTPERIKTAILCLKGISRDQKVQCNGFLDDS